MSNNITYRLGEAPKRRLGSITYYFGNALAIFGGLALLAFIVDSMFFNNAGLSNTLIWIWEVAN